MKSVLLLFLIAISLSISTNASAEWKWAATVGQCESTYVNPDGLSCRSILLSKSCSSWSTSPHYCKFSTKPHPTNPYGDDYLVRTAYYWDSPDPVVFPPGGETVYGAVYTDEQCQAQYGTASVLITEGSPGPYNVGACSLTSASGSVGVCTFYDNQGNPAPDGSCYLYGDFIATTTGDTNTPGGAAVDSNPETPDYLTETDDPDSCPAGSVSYGGTSYCVDQSAIDDGSVSIIGGDDGSTDPEPDPYDPNAGAGGADLTGDQQGTSIGGTTTTTTDNGDGTSTTTTTEIEFDVSALVGAMQKGFKNVVDKIDELIGEPVDVDSVIANSGIDESFSDVDTAEQELDQALEDAKEQVGDGANSSIAEQVTSYMPSLPSASCTGFNFGSNQPWAFSVDCEGLNMVKGWLGWLLYFWTAYSIINLFLDNSARKVS